MITREIEQLLRTHHVTSGVSVRISVPGGSELALKTFNPKLGITGGISIIGTSGIVRPFSSEAFVNSIRKEIQVAHALGCTRLVINSGAKSENYLRSRFPDLPPQAFVHYGNYIGDTLRAADEDGITAITMGIMIGKAVKLAEGHLDTHSRNVVMNRDFITALARESNCPPTAIARIANLTLARELWELFADTPAFFNLLVERCLHVCHPLHPHATLDIILVPENSPE